MQTRTVSGAPEESEDGAAPAAIRRLIGDNISRLRNMRGWNQERLAERAGVSPELISMFETHKRVGRIKTLAAIAAALSEPLSELFRANNVTMPQALAAFLESPMAVGVSDEEALLLKEITIPGRKLTVESYYLALKMIRASEPTE